MEISLGLPTFIGDDLRATRDVARQNLVLYTGFPFFQGMFRHSGFTAEAAQMEQGAGLISLTDHLLHAICLVGPVAGCRDQLATFRRAGVGLPVLYPPEGVDAARAVIQAFRR